MILKCDSQIKTHSFKKLILKSETMSETLSEKVEIFTTVFPWLSHLIFIHVQEINKHVKFAM